MEILDERSIDIRVPTMHTTPIFANLNGFTANTISG
jgi:hypothetical protein